jgi:hypothetical protein
MPRILFESQSFLFDQRLGKALWPFTQRLKGKKRHASFIYNYFVDASLAPKVVLARLASKGLTAFVLTKHPERLPTAEISRAFPWTKACRASHAAERRCEQKAMAAVTGLIERLKQAGAVHHFTVDFGSSHSKSFTIDATVSLNPAKVNEALSRLRNEKAKVRQLRRPSSYAVQVAHSTHLTPQRLSEQAARFTFVKKVAAYPQ